MKRILISIFAFALIAAMLLVFVGCLPVPGGNGTGDNSEGTGDGSGNGDGDENEGEGGGESDGDNEDGEDEELVIDPTKLVLVKDYVASFKVVYTSEAGSDGVRGANEFVKKLRNLGIDVADPVADGDRAAVTDCEIIIGTGARNRGDDCNVNAKALGVDGHVIKVVGDRVVVAGGTSKSTMEQFNKFVSTRLGLSDTATSVERIISVDRAYFTEVLTEYQIETIRIAGYDLSKYTLIYDIDAMGAYNTGILTQFRNDLYNASGYWLNQDTIQNVDKYSQRFFIRYVEDAGEDGFRIYVDGNDFVVECAYANAFEPAMAEFTEKYIYSNKTGIVSFASNFKYSTNVSTVHYKDFGAVGDGVADDFAAILATHEYANAGGQKVYGDEGATYAIYADSFISTIPIKTDTDFNGATFVIDDTGSMAYACRNLALFTLARENSYNQIAQPLLTDLFGEVSLSAGDTSIPWIVDRLTAEKTMVMVYHADHNDYIRHGSNQNNGSLRHEALIVYADGTLAEDTPVSFDYDYIGKILIYNVDDPTIRVGNGIFHNICNRTVKETDYMVKYHSYNRGFKIERFNSVLYDLTHRILEEPELDITYAGDDDDNYLSSRYGSRRESYPYNRGFFYIKDTYNLLIENCSITGHTTYYEEKAGTASSNAGGTNYVPAGSYDYVVEHSTNITFKNVTQYNNSEAGLGDSRYWGIMSSNFARNLEFIDCEINRFDAHQGFFNGKLINTTIGHTLNVIGGGDFYLENVTRLTGGAFMSLRGDYGATFKGDMTIKDCTLMAYNTYNTSKGGKLNTGAHVKNGYVISSGWAGNNNSGYWDWDFGYTCYMPQNITFVGKFNYKSTNLYIYNSNFNAYHTYVKSQPEGFIPYQVTKTITYQDWTQAQIPINSGTVGTIFENTKVQTVTSKKES